MWSLVITKFWHNNKSRSHGVSLAKKLSHRYEKLSLIEMCYTQAYSLSKVGSVMPHSSIYWRILLVFIQEKTVCSWLELALVWSLMPMLWLAANQIARFLYKLYLINFWIVMECFIIYLKASDFYGSNRINHLTRFMQKSALLINLNANFF